MQDPMLAPCSDWEGKLTATHLDDLSSTEREALRGHVRWCSACAAFLADSRKMDRLIRVSLEPQRPLLLPTVLFHSRGPVQGIEGYLKNETRPARFQTFPLLKTFIGDYYITGQIANGILGNVYQGKRFQIPDRIFAIKLLHTIPLDLPEEQEQFLQETQLLGKLRHPYILPVVDAGIHEGLPYLVTEYVSHGSLQTLLDQQSPYPLAVEQALPILSQIGQALQHAHQWNFMHDDLKPSRILFNVHREVVLADFGTVTSATRAMSRERALMNVHPYMAPEQLRGEMSKQSNQYALACIAYRLLTGRAPLEATERGEVPYEHLLTNPFSPTQLDVKLVLALEGILLKALAKDPADRYPAVSAFTDALTQAYRSTGSV